MAARQNYYAESVAESTYNTDTAYQDKVSLVFTPDANSIYMILASWLQTASSESYYCYGKSMRSSGTPKDFNEIIFRRKDALDYKAGGCVTYESFGESPTEQTYKIQYRTGNVVGTAKIKEAKIIAIKLDADDKTAQTEARGTTTAATMQDRATLTFTPATVGDYIIFATATIDESVNTSDVICCLDVDGVEYSIENKAPYQGANKEFWGTMKRISLSAASHTIKIKWCTETAGTTTAGIAHANIVALRADKFANNYYAEEEARETTTTTASYVDKHTLTQTPLAQDHLQIGVCGGDNSTLTTPVYMRFIKGATSFGEMIEEQLDVTTRHASYFSIKKETLSAAETTWKIQFHAGSTAGCQDSRISIIELNQAAGKSAASSVSGNGSTVGAVQKGGRDSVLASIAGAVVAIGIAGMLAATSIFGSGSPNVATQKAISSDATVSGGGSITAEERKNTGESSTISANGEVIANIKKGGVSESFISNNGNLIVSANKSPSSSASIPANGSIETTALKIGQATSSISGNGILEGIGKKQVSGDSIISGNGSLVVIGTTGEVYSGIVSISANGEVAGIGIKAAKEITLLSGNGSIETIFIKSAEGLSLISGNGSVIISKPEEYFGSTIIFGSGNLVCRGVKEITILEVRRRLTAYEKAEDLDGLGIHSRPLVRWHDKPLGN